MNRPARWMRKGSQAPASLYVLDCTTLQLSAWVRADTPPCLSTSGTPVVSARAAAVLGENGVQRIHEFWSYPEGWDFGAGTPLSPSSLVLLEAFLATFTDFGSTPSVFLSQDGNLVLAWEDAGGYRIEVEFAPSGIELYFASNDEEITFDIADIQVSMMAVVEELRRHDADAA